MPRPLQAQRGRVRLPAVHKRAALQVAGGGRFGPHHGDFHELVCAVAIGVTSSPAAQGLLALDAGVLLAGLDDQADIGEAAGGTDAGQDPNDVVRIADLPEL